MKTRLNAEKQRIGIAYFLKSYRFYYRRLDILPCYMDQYYARIVVFYDLGFISASTFARCYHMKQEYKRRWKDGYYK